jgi:hypothetical protein
MAAVSLVPLSWMPMIRLSVSPFGMSCAPPYVPWRPSIFEMPASPHHSTPHVGRSSAAVPAAR